VSDTPKCEPPEDRSGADGWHWVEAPAIKMQFVRRWWRARGEWCWADMDERTLRSFRYLCPVLTPAEAEALRANRDDWQQAAQVEAAQVNVLRARVAVLEEALKKIAAPLDLRDVPHTKGNAVTWRMEAARAALSTGSETPAGARGEP
jgi:predicted DNA-binding protein (UPF0251 family)